MAVRKRRRGVRGNRTKNGRFRREKTAGIDQGNGGSSRFKHARNKKREKEGHQPGGPLFFRKSQAQNKKKDTDHTKSEGQISIKAAGTEKIESIERNI